MCTAGCDVVKDSKITKGSDVWFWMTHHQTLTPPKPIPTQKLKIDTIKICKVKLNMANNEYISATMLRGFLGTLFVDDAEFHHHSEQSYHYPLIQYKRVKDQLMVFGFQNYAGVLMNKMSDVDEIATRFGKFKIESQDIQLSNHKVCNRGGFYDFITPWIPFNQQNYVEFCKCSQEEQKEMLEKMIVTNTLSCLKGVGVFVDFRVEAYIVSYKQFPVEVHDNPFVGFTARFVVNVDLPDYIGLGKSVSKGHGCIRRVRD